MRSTLTVFLSFSLYLHLSGQVIEGRILDSLDNTPLEYANIGLVGTRFGNITDQLGVFQLEAPEQDSESLVRISMIGYRAQTFTLAELRDSENQRQGHFRIPPFQYQKEPGTHLYKMGS